MYWLDNNIILISCGWLKLTPYFLNEIESDYVQ